MKMKSERPLLIDGVPCTEFKTTEHHGRELIAAGLAVEVKEKGDKSDEAPAKPVEKSVEPATAAKSKK